MTNSPFIQFSNQISLVEQAKHRVLPDVLSIHEIAELRYRGSDEEQNSYKRILIECVKHRIFEPYTCEKYCQDFYPFFDKHEVIPQVILDEWIVSKDKSLVSSFLFTNKLQAIPHQIVIQYINRRIAVHDINLSAQILADIKSKRWTQANHISAKMPVLSGMRQYYRYETYLVSLSVANDMLGHYSPAPLPARIEEFNPFARDFIKLTFHKSDFKSFLMATNEWPLTDCLLKNWFDHKTTPNLDAKRHAKSIYARSPIRTFVKQQAKTIWLKEPESTPGLVVKQIIPIINSNLKQFGLKSAPSSKTLNRWVKDIFTGPPIHKPIKTPIKT